MVLCAALLPTRAEVICAAVHTLNAMSEDVLSTIFEGLARGLRENSSTGKLAAPDSATRGNGTNLRVKCEYQGEKRVIDLCRPPRLSDLLAKISKYYNRDFNLCFILSNEQISFPIRCQEEFDKAINLTDLNSRARCLHLLLEPVLNGTRSKLPSNATSSAQVPSRCSAGPVSYSSRSLAACRDLSPRPQAHCRPKSSHQMYHWNNVQATPCQLLVMGNSFRMTMTKT